VPRYRKLALFLLLASIWGSAFIVIKAGLGLLPPMLFAAIRYDLAGVLVLAYTWSVTDQPVTFVLHFDSSPSSERSRSTCYLAQAISSCSTFLRQIRVIRFSRTLLLRGYHGDRMHQ